MLKWTSALSVGIEEIDVQHQELFRRAERLLAGLHQGEPEEIGGLIDFLHEYAVVHFGAEEAAMRAASFPGYVRHKAEHDRFIGDLLDLGDHEGARLPDGHGDGPVPRPPERLALALRGLDSGRRVVLQCLPHRAGPSRASSPTRSSHPTPAAAGEGGQQRTTSNRRPGSPRGLWGARSFLEAPCPSRSRE